MEKNEFLTIKGPSVFMRPSQLYSKTFHEENMNTLDPSVCLIFPGDIMFQSLYPNDLTVFEETRT